MRRPCSATRVALAALWLALATGGCDGETPGDDDATGDDDASGDDDATGDDDDFTVPELRGECALEDRFGYFHVQHEPDQSWVSGEVADGVVPITILEQVGEVGDCRLMRRNNPFCEPPCDPGFTCDFDGSCIPYPQPVDVGTITVDGLEKDVSMSFPTYYDTQMPHPPFLPDAPVRLRAAGAAGDGFELFGAGVVPIATADEVWVVREGEAMTVQWESAAGEHAHVLLRFNIDQHGNSPVELVCALDDDGSAEIPSQLLDELIGYGVSGFPSGHLYRRTVDSVAWSSGCVEFVVFSHLQGNLQVEGHIPCDSPDDCPDGMECDLPTNTCV